MEVTELKVTNFRNYNKAEWKFDRKTVILGENGAGKTNILEAIYLLATGKSYRAGKEEELLHYGAAFSLLRFSSFAGQANNLKTEFQITLSDGTGMGHKKFEVNGIPRRMIDAVGKFKAVWFGPEDIEIITGSPSYRRRYLDFVLTQKDREYRRSLVSYEKGVRQRNRILENIREGIATRSQLFFWDRLLIKDGNYITQAREKYLTRLSNQEPITKLQDTKYQIIYDKSIISEPRLKQYEYEEVAAASTLVGPHRDDFVITQIPNPKLQDIPVHRTEDPRQAVGTNKFQDTSDKIQTYIDVAKYGSRGEQRMAVLWLKLGERDFLQTEGELPVLLLDDIFSELDHKHRDEVMKLMEDQIARGGQVIMTTADQHMMPHDSWNIIQLS